MSLSTNTQQGYNTRNDFIKVIFKRRLTKVTNTENTICINAYYESLIISFLMAYITKLAVFLHAVFSRIL